MRFKDRILFHDIYVGDDINIHVKRSKRLRQRRHSMLAAGMNEQYVWLQITVHVGQVQNCTVKHTVGMACTRFG